MDYKLFDTNEPRHLLEEVLTVLCGRKLGEGHARETYLCALNPKLVIKYEKQSKAFNNIREWESWTEWGSVEGVGEWLAPCVEISPCGRLLIQKRTKPVTLACDWPDKVPGFMTDLKYENFGMYEGRFVCHDYGYLIRKTPNTRLKKAAWWSEEDHWDALND